MLKMQASDFRGPSGQWKAREVPLQIALAAGYPGGFIGAGKSRPDMPILKHATTEYAKVQQATLEF